MFFAVFVLVGYLIGILVQPAPKNQVLYCRERDRRGEQHNIVKEDAISLETKNPELRFFKFGHAFVFDVKRRFGKVKKVARFLAKESTAFTWNLFGSGVEVTKWKKMDFTARDPTTEEIVTVTKKVPIKYKPSSKEIDLQFPTLEDAVKFKCGTDNYNAFPIAIKDKLKENKMMVTVGLEAGLTPEGYKPATEEMIWEKGNERVAEMFSGKIKSALKGGVIDKIPWIGTGGVIVLIGAILMGWIKIG